MWSVRQGLQEFIEFPIHSLHGVDLLVVLGEVDASSVSSPLQGGLTVDAALKRLCQALYAERPDKS